MPRSSGRPLHLQFPSCSSRCGGALIPEGRCKRIKVLGKDHQRTRPFCNTCADSVTSTCRSRRSCCCHRASSPTSTPPPSATSLAPTATRSAAKDLQVYCRALVNPRQYTVMLSHVGAKAFSRESGESSW